MRAVVVVASELVATHSRVFRWPDKKNNQSYCKELELRTVTIKLSVESRFGSW
jgi:hypothetical protein